MTSPRTILIIALIVLGGAIPLGLARLPADRMPGIGSSCPAGAILGNSNAAPVSQAGLPFRDSSRFEQWLAVITGFVIKPLYMAIALALAVLLWRRTAADLRALRWAMATFFLGEAACALNYLFYGEQSMLFEFLHSYGMVLAFGFTAYAIMAWLDLRVLHYSDPKTPCAALPMCRACTRYDETAPCALRRLFWLAIPATIVLAAIPLAATVRSTAYNTRIFGTLYTYSHAIAHQAYEIRFLPLAAIVLLIAAMLVLLREKHPVASSKVLFAAALGAVGFSYFRLILLGTFEHNQVYFATWEEVTELLYVLAFAWMLFVFRRGLFAHEVGK